MHPVTNFEKVEIKITLITAGSILVGFTSLCITLGVYLGNWSEWRTGTDKNINCVNQRVDKVELRQDHITSLMYKQKN